MDKKPAGSFASLLTSNAPPSETDAASLHNVLAHLGKQLAGIDESIARLQLHLRELQKTRQGVLDDVKRIRTVLSPIRRLPPEILCDIFALCIPRETSTSFRGKHLKFPWVATRVCRSWRDAGAANAAFWCRVDSGTPLPVVRLQLERSRQCALDVDVGFADCEILGLLAGHSERWETVSIAASANMLPILDSVRNRIPRLRWLLYIDSTGVGECWGFSVAPLLTSAFVLGKTRMVHLPWGQLTRLRQRIPHDDFSQLQSASNLVELSLTNTVSLSLLVARAEGTLSPSMVTFPLLEQLSVEDTSCLDMLSTPSLQDLFLVGAEHGELVPFVARSGCQLHVLRCGKGLELDSISACLPTLEELHLGSRPGFSVANLIQILHPSGASGNRGPKLHTLTLSDVDISGLYETLTDMALSRIRAGPNSLCLTILNTTQSALRFDSDALHVWQSMLLREGVRAEWLEGRGSKQRIKTWAEDYP